MRAEGSKESEEDQNVRLSSTGRKAGTGNREHPLQRPAPIKTLKRAMQTQVVTVRDNVSEGWWSSNVYKQRCDMTGRQGMGFDGRAWEMERRLCRFQLGFKWSKSAIHLQCAENDAYNGQWIGVAASSRVEKATGCKMHRNVSPRMGWVGMGAAWPSIYRYLPVLAG